MGTMKLLVIIALFWLGWIIWRRYLVYRAMFKKSQEEHYSQVLPCHYCGLHVPEEESIVVNNKVYCCQAHYQQEQQASEPNRKNAS